MNINNIESGVQLFSRVSSRNEKLSCLNENFFGEGDLSNTSVEIISDYTIDKSNLLIDFIIRCILPTSLNKDWKNCGVVFINTNFQIGVFQIIKTIDQHLKDINVKNRKPIIEESLKNLVILDCFNWAQLEITIYSLEEKIKKRPNICTLVLDDIGAFYWIKRQNEEMLSVYMHSQKIFSLIRNQIISLSLFFIFSRTENNEEHHDKRLSENVDFQISVNRLNEHSFEAKVRSYKSDQDILVPFLCETFKIVFQ